MRIARKLGISRDQIFIPRRRGAGKDKRAAIHARLSGKTLEVGAQIFSDDVSAGDLELAVFYERPGVVGRRVIIPSKNYSDVLCSVVNLEFAPSEVEVRLYELGCIIDQVILESDMS
jgi:hypothetical protein